MKCLVFENKESAEINEGIICLNIVVRSWNDIRLIDKNNEVVSDITVFITMPDNDKRLCKALGKNAQTGEWVKTEGYTTRYAEPANIYNTEQWYIPKPHEDLMEGVSGYQELDFESSWHPVVEM